MNDQRLFDLSGKVAMITGASRGIGEAFAVAYAQAGAKVVLASRKQTDLDGLAQRIREAGGEALPLAAHTGDATAVCWVVAKAGSLDGGNDILLDNTGTQPHLRTHPNAADNSCDTMLALQVTRC